jgi:cellulose synthase/poly-beta-1,6-N-acetylglucosamine synthase-like glycosyltransferase
MQLSGTSTNLMFVQYIIVIYAFIYNLCNEAVTNSEYIASNIVIKDL